MNDDFGRLLSLADAVADGRLIDWPAEESSRHSRGPAFIAQLRVLSGLAASSSHVTWGGACCHCGRISRRSGRHGRLSRSRDNPAGDAPIRLLPRQIPTAILGSLEFLEQVGRGSFGAVFRAWDRRLDRQVALKLLHRPNLGD